MTDLEKAARMALEALEVATTPLAKDRQEVLRAQAALRQALEQPQDEWLTGCPECGMDGECGCDKKSEPAQQQEPKLSEIFCVVDFADKLLSVSVLRRRNDDVAELLHFEQIALPAQQEPVDWEAVAADQAMTIAMMKAEQEAAVLAEREACAQLADEAADNAGDPYCCTLECRGIAEAIRARGQA